MTRFTDNRDMNEIERVDKATIEAMRLMIETYRWTIRDLRAELDVERQKQKTSQEARWV